MPDFEVIHIDGVGSIKRATPQFLAKRQAQCEKDHTCFMCGDPLEYVAYKMTQHGIRRVMCDYCEREEFGD
jgi:uncharacterized CHY-type Zn-finger protein